MNWLKAENIETAAEAGEKEAVACTVKHWTQVLTATKAELVEGLKEHQVGYNSDWCALCTRFCRNLENGICPFCDDTQSIMIGYCDYVCNQLYWKARTAVSAFKHRRINITRMRTFVKPVVNRLTEIYNSYPKENNL